MRDVAASMLALHGSPADCTEDDRVLRKACLCIVMHRLAKVQCGPPYECPQRQILAVYDDAVPARQHRDAKTVRVRSQYRCTATDCAFLERPKNERSTLQPFCTIWKDFKHTARHHWEGLCSTAHI